jgi:hypothetical protein
MARIIWAGKENDITAIIIDENFLKGYTYKR